MYLVIEEIDKLVEAWKQEAQRLQGRYGEVLAARTMSTLATELADRLRKIRNRTLDLKEAADLSGYTPYHLGRLVAGGTIPNAGEKYAPRIRLGDLPRKPGALRPEGSGGDVVTAREQVVRSVANPN